MKKIFCVICMLMLLFLCAVCASAAYSNRPYEESDHTRILDGVVYERDGSSWYVRDYFATQEIAKTATEIRIVGEIDGAPVTAIDHYIGAMESEKGTFRNVRKIILPDTLQSLGNRCFSFLDGIKKLIIPASVESFGEAPFADMESLETVSIRAQLQTIGDEWFWNCKKLKSVKWQGELTCIGQNAFANCASLKTLKIPKTLQALGGSAFQNSGLTVVTLPANVAYYGHEAPEGETFRGCKQLKKVTFSAPANKMMTLPASMFAGCTALKQVSVPSTVKMISVQAYAFKGCKALTKVSFADRITGLEKGCFQNCSSLTSFTLAKKMQFIKSSAFSGCTNLKKLRVLATKTNFLQKESGAAFLKKLPDQCKIYVKTTKVHKAFLNAGCKNRVIVKADLA